MKRVAIKDLKPGMVLGKTLYGVTGEALLKKGVFLTDSFIDSIRQRGFSVVYVKDGFGDDAEAPDVVTEQVRESLQKRVCELFEISLKATANSEVSSQRTLNLFQSYFSEFEGLYVDVEGIIDDVMEADILTEITSLKSHDNYAFCHAIDVAVVALILAKRLGLNRNDLRKLALGCLLHDIGKIKVDPAILNKSAKLSNEERKIYQMHTVWGHDIIKSMPIESPTPRKIALSHHERQDGTGFPKQLRGLDRIRRTPQERASIFRIPLLVEITTVGNVYANLSSDRPNRPALNTESILSTMNVLSSSYLNKELVRRFLNTVPAFPKGVGIVVDEGAYEGYKGVVVELNPTRLDRPIVRLYFDPAGNSINPFELDTASSPDTVIHSVIDPTSSGVDLPLFPNA